MFIVFLMKGDAKIAKVEFFFRYVYSIYQEKLNFKSEFLKKNKEK